MAAQGCDQLVDEVQVQILEEVQPLVLATSVQEFKV